MKVDYELEVVLYACASINLRCDSLEYEFHLGYGVLEDMYDKLRVREDVETLTLSFPERFLNITERRILLKKISHFCPNVKKVTIKTHCPMVVQQCPNGSVSVFDQGPKDSGDIHKRHYPTEEQLNYFDVKKLNVI